MIRKAGCEVLFLPPYSPDLNLIEKFGQILRGRVKEVLHLYANLAEAMGQSFLQVCS